MVASRVASMKNTWLWLALAVCILGVYQESWAWTDGEIRESIEAILKVRHPNETRDWWRSLGAGTPRILISMFKAESSIYHQIRLVDAMAWFDDPAVVEFLKDQAAHHENESVRRAAIRSVGLSQGVKEKAFLKQSLESSDPHARLVAAKLLRDFKNPAADQIVNEHLKTEKANWVSTGIRQHGLRRGNKLVIEGKRESSR